MVRPARDPHDPVAREYSRLARRYDRRWASYVERTVHETLRRMPLQPRLRLLDVACGTGALLEVVAGREPGVELHGTDLSPEMLAVARSRLGEAAALCEASAGDLPYDDGRFDLVVSTSAFHYFREPAAALAEMRRVLKPGGRLIITDWCDDYLACRICDRVLRLVDRAHHRIYDAAACRGLIEQARFAAVDVERFRIDWLWGMMTATGRKPVDAAG